jgi:outer membrane lipoprotein-sorting protein
MRLPSRSQALLVSVTIAAALLLLAGTAAFARQDTPRQSAPRQDSFDDLYLRGQRANAAIKTLTAHFTEVTSSSLLTRQLVSHGRLAVERPARVVLRYTQPEGRVILIDGNRMTMSWPSHNLRQTTDIGTAQGRVQKYFVNGTAADLRRQFEIEARDDGDGRPGAYYVSMVPKRKQIRETLARLELWVGRTSMLLEGMKMTFANGDLKTMTFEDVVANAPLDARTFSLDR